MALVRQLWQDEFGIAYSADAVLLITLLGIAVVVGLQTVRNAVIQEFGDSAVALESLDQSYSFMVNGTTSTFTDTNTLTDPAGEAPACMNVGIGATAE